MISDLVLPMPFDAHVHMRRGEMLTRVLKYTARQFGTALVMPNTVPGIFTGSDVNAYRGEIKSELNGEKFEPLMAIKLRNNTTVEMIDEAHHAGAIAAKLYPRGVTTNSDDGVDIERITDLFPVFELMRKRKMLLLLHGEHPNSYYTDAEKDFLDVLKQLHARFPRLHIVLEHVSTGDAVWVVRSLGRTVTATITIHHMVLNGNDVAKGKFRPHYYCLPMAKRPGDRDVVLAAAISGDPKFFLGTDSAPHLLSSKLCDECSGGIFTAPYALEYLATIFERNNALEKLSNFVGGYGYEHYEIKPLPGKVRLARESWEPDDEYDGVKAFKYLESGEKKFVLPWKFVGKE